jgi:hypothetical protein
MRQKPAELVFTSPAGFFRFWKYGIVCGRWPEGAFVNDLSVFLSIGMEETDQRDTSFVSVESITRS